MLVIGGILVITQVASVCAMDLALADGDDERNQELVVRNGQGDARLHLVIGEVLMDDYVYDAVDIEEGGFAVAFFGAVAVIPVSRFRESAPAGFAGVTLAFVLDVHLF